MENYEKAGAMALNSIFGYEPKISRCIIETLGNASALFDLSEADLSELFGPWSRYRGRLDRTSLENALSELERLEARGYQIVSMVEDDYPKTLLECEDPPVCLYVRSNCPAGEIFGREPRVAVVGTRDISPYGIEWCRRIVDAMSRTEGKPVIVSGLALGVDVTAHEAALSCGLPTIAVIPTGIDEVYPRRHCGVAQAIQEAPGSALITDYPPGTIPQAVNFLRRNRIIAGLSQATVLIESKVKGGGTMTARLAYGYGRDVYALPGRIDDVRSMGCNALIQEKVAESISSLEAFIVSLGLGRWSRRTKSGLENELRRHFGGRTSEDLDLLVRVALAVKAKRGITVEEICESLGISYAQSASTISLLEQEGFLGMDLLQRCFLNFRL